MRALRRLQLFGKPQVSSPDVVPWFRSGAVAVGSSRQVSRRAVRPESGCLCLILAMIAVDLELCSLASTR